MALTRRTKLLLVAFAPIELATLLLVAFLIFTTHRPWVVPPEHQPPAAWRTKPEGGLSLRSLGVSGWEVSDGTTTLLLDPTPTRPPPMALLTGPIEADLALGEKWCPKADAILVNHTHFDHALDTGEIALRTGALVLGSRNTVNLALSRGVPVEKTRVVRDSERFTVGTFDIFVKKTVHTRLLVEQPMSGVIEPERKPLWFWQYALDETYAYRLEAGGTTLWFRPGTAFAAGDTGGLTAKNLIIGVSGERLKKERVTALVNEVKPTRVLPTHFDNFFQPVDLGLALLTGVDLDEARALFFDAAPGVEWGVVGLNEVIWLPPDN